MGSVIDFREASNDLMNEEACKPPIEVERFGLSSIIVRFRVDLFELKRLDFALHNAFRCQDFWEIAKLPDILEENPNPMLASYLINVSDTPSMRVDDALRQALYLATQAVYIEETRLRRTRGISLEVIPDPSQGLKIKPKTLRSLYRAGICTLYDLVKKKREDFTGIPGMTTEEIFNLEKVLASRGWFLVTSTIPAWE